jgi:hypothetical protein
MGSVDSIGVGRDRADNKRSKIGSMVYTARPMASARYRLTFDAGKNDVPQLARSSGFLIRTRKN